MAAFPLECLPLGYRFRPTGEELVDYYLRQKINGIEEDVSVIREVDIYKSEPWELPALSVLESKDEEWFFFCPREQKYPRVPSGLRWNRATATGYWKPTGWDRKIKSRACVIGMKKTLVFYKGRAPKGQRTHWKIHEFSMKGGQDAYVLCRLFKSHDEKISGFHGDEVEPAVSSTTPQESSVYQDEDFNRTTLNTLIPVDNQVAEVTDSAPQWEQFLSELEAELGPSVHYPATDDLINGDDGLQFEIGTNEHGADNLKYVYTVCNTSDEFEKNLAVQSETPMNVTIESQNLASIVKEGGSCSTESHPDVAQAQIKEADHLNIGTGIRINIRTCPPENSAGTQNIFNQGMAPRRIRLQSRVEDGSLFSCEMRKLCCSGENDEAKSTVTEVRREKNIPPVFLKTPLARLPVLLSSVYLVRVFVVVVLFMIFICIWKLKFLM